MENVVHSALHMLPVCLSLPVPDNMWSHYICIMIICTTSNNQIPYNASPLFSRFLNNEIWPPQCLKLVFLFMKSQSTNHNVLVFSKFTFTTTKIVLTNINFCIHRRACIFIFLHLFWGVGGMYWGYWFASVFCLFCQIEAVLFLKHLLSFMRIGPCIILIFE